MPPALRKGIAQTILMLMGGTSLTGMVGWMGLELVQSHDNNIKSQHVSEAVDKILLNEVKSSERHSQLMQVVIANQMDIKLIQNNLQHCIIDITENKLHIETCKKIVHGAKK